MITFITFANTEFMQTSRIINEATESKMFDNIMSKNEHDISEFIEKHSKFINDNPRGYGFWIWKPKIILDTLLKLPDDDILIYADAGVHINKNGKKRFNEYISYLDNHDMVMFSNSHKYKASKYIKIDAVLNYFPQLYKQYGRKAVLNKNINNTYHYGGCLILKKTPQVIKLLKDWLSLCENYHLLDRSKSNYREPRFYRGQDADNGLLALCLMKYNIHKSIPYNETNIFDERGFQAIHAGMRKINWNLLNDFPIQFRRIRPGQKC